MLVVGTTLPIEDLSLARLQCNEIANGVLDNGTLVVEIGRI